MAASRTYLQEVLADNPVLAFSCNETTGTVLADATGHGYSGTLSGTYVLAQPPMTSGLGKSIKFTAGGISVPYDAAFEYTNDWAVELVVSLSTTTLGNVFGFMNRFNDPYNGPAVYFNNQVAGGITVRDSTAGLASVGSVADGVFRHLVLGRRGSNLEIWVNGILVGLATGVPVHLKDNAEKMTFMMFPGGGQFTNGNLDEAAYYVSMPSPQRIAVHAARALDKRMLAGSAKLSTGDPASAVLVRRWDTHVHISQATPDASGNWSTYVDSGDYEVTTIGPSGYQPICHGPVTALDF